MLRGELRVEMNALGVSAVICCHNGASRLPETPAHIARQSNATQIPCEVLLVDNVSTDGSADIARSVWQDLGAPFPLRVVLEAKLGVVHARITGLSEASYEFVTFVDDDNHIEPNWFGRILDVMKTYPRLAVLAAEGVAFTDPGREFPEWFDSIRHCYAIGPQNHGSAKRKGALAAYYWAGLTLRVSAIRAVLEQGFRPILTGRGGKKLSAGEDSELTLILQMKGWDVTVDPTLKFRHYMPPGRLTSDYAERLLHGLGESTGPLDVYFRVGSGGVAGARPAIAAWLASGLAIARIREARSRKVERRGASETAKVSARLSAQFQAGRAKGCADTLANLGAVLDQVRANVGHRPTLGRRDIAIEQSVLDGSRKDAAVV
jgi:hypothetical protein